MHEIIMQQAVMVANGFQGFSRPGTTWVPLMLIDLHRFKRGFVPTIIGRFSYTEILAPDDS